MPLSFQMRLDRRRGDENRTPAMARTQKQVSCQDAAPTHVSEGLSCEMHISIENLFYGYCGTTGMNPRRWRRGRNLRQCPPAERRPAGVQPGLLNDLPKHSLFWQGRRRWAPAGDWFGNGVSRSEYESEGEGAVAGQLTALGSMITALANVAQWFL